MDITTKEELFQVITDLQGQVVNLQETVDKLSPVEEESVDPEETEETKEEELSEEEVSEIDKMLQES